MKTVKDYNLPLNSLKQTTTRRKNKHCAILPSLCRHCQSKASTAEYGRRLCLFCPSNKL